jgi:hypothetical protein
VETQEIDDYKLYRKVMVHRNRLAAHVSMGEVDRCLRQLSPKQSMMITVV